LRGFPWLDRLILDHSPITDVGLQEIGQFRQLSALGLRRTKITDERL
jgi:hypothetical protein